MTKRLHTDVHVFPTSSAKLNAQIAHWEIRCERPYIVAYCPTQKMAASLGRALAKLTKTELVVHGKDGKIRRKDSFGNDPCPPKG
jgi:hypothetical protein